MAIKKERKPRVVTKKALTKAQRIADEINSLVVGKYMVSKALEEKNAEEMAMWIEHIQAATDALKDLGIPMGWRMVEKTEREIQNLPIQQDIPFD